MTRVADFRRKIRLSLWLPAALLLCAGALQAQQEQEGNIAGQVRLVDGGFAPAQLQVTLEAHGAVADVTYCDAEGRFSFNHLLPNAYDVIIRADGFQPIQLTVVVNPVTMSTNLVHIVLQPLTRPTKTLPAGQNQDVVGVADLSSKYPLAVKKEFEAGRKAEEQNDTASAIKHYQAALRLAPDFYQAHNNLGGAYIKRGDLQDAESELRRALQLDPNSAQAEFNLGNVLYLTGREAEAKKVLEDGLRHSPGSAMGRYFVGCVLVRLREFAPAEQQLKSARQLDPRMPEVPIALATLYLQTGRQPEAIQMFEDFLQKFPENPLAPKVRAAVEKLSSQASAP